jgi:hypothetical protein
MSFWHEEKWASHHGRELALKVESSGLYLDVEGGSDKDGAHIHQWTWNGGANQLFELHYHDDDESFSIKCKNSGKYWDVEGASTEVGARVLQYHYHGGDNQRFYIEHCEDGAYAIYAKHSDLYIGIHREHHHHHHHGGESQEGLKLVQQEWAGETYQRFFLCPVAIHQDKVVYIEAVHSRKYVDVSDCSRNDGAVIHQWSFTGADNQKWKMHYNSQDDTYVFESVHSGKCLDVEGASYSQGAKVHQWSWSNGGTDNQRWKLVKVGSDTYALRSKHSGQYVDVDGVSHHDGAILHQWEYTGAENQHFRFIQA